MKHILSLCSLLLALCSVYANSPYISRVYEYCPAPGQFINTMPAYQEGDNAADMAQKTEECLANNAQTMICLGAFGGYVTFGFDHPVVNKSGEYDLKILGNAFYAQSNPNPDATKKGGSSEPGIVMVSQDVNQNGLPDDPWYELAGSHYDSLGTIHNYEITYYRPDTLTDDVSWCDNQGATGFVNRNPFHKQAYYPEWMGDSITFKGTCLPPNGVDESGNGSYFVLYCFDWGYVDNHPNDNEQHLSEFNLDWAVDDEGQPVQLKSVDFVRVYTAVNQMAGRLGETSTEILDAMDLHPEETIIIESVPSAENANYKSASKMMRNGQLIICNHGMYYDIYGKQININY